MDEGGLTGTRRLELLALLLEILDTAAPRPWRELARLACVLAPADGACVLEPVGDGARAVRSAAGCGAQEGLVLRGREPDAGRLRDVLILGSSQELTALLGGDAAVLGGPQALLVPLRPPARPGSLLAVLRRRPPFQEEDGLALTVLVAAAARAMQAGKARRLLRGSARRTRSALRKLDAAGEGLVEMQRRKAVGELVRGLAHELNNPLSAIAGHAQLLARMLRLDAEQARVSAERILGQAERCSLLLSNFAGFAAGFEPGPAVRLVRLVADTLALQHYTLRRDGITTEVEVPESLPVPAIDQGALQQVLLNLVANACTAMRGCTTRLLRISARCEGGRCLLQVADTGRGIPRGIRGRIFEPFFSTREDEEASGLGLPASVALLESCGGALHVESQEGRGSCFTVSVPQHPGEDQAPSGTPSPLKARRRSSA